MDFVLERREKDKNRSHTNPAQIKDISTLIHNFIVLFVHRILFFCFFLFASAILFHCHFVGYTFFRFTSNAMFFFSSVFFPTFSNGDQLLLLQFQKIKEHIQQRIPSEWRKKRTITTETLFCIFRWFSSFTQM